MLEFDALVSLSGQVEKGPVQNVLISDQRVASDAESAEQFVKSCNKLLV